MNDVEQIIRTAYDQLLERERRLERAAGELAHVRRHRLALEKLLPKTGSAPATAPARTGGAAPSAPRQQAPIGLTGGFPAEVIAAVKGSLDGLTGPQIAEKIGREWAPWMSAQLARILRAGGLIVVKQTADGPLYGIPQAIDQAGSDYDAAIA